ncbi:MAG TPA: hypothetical protein DDZ83_18500 [Nitrospinae bacterium]|nr:hypothetical protein [Nitrospinota bacterium]
MNPKKNLILLLVLAIGAGAYYFYDVKWAGEKKVEKERKAKILKGIDEKRLIRLSLQRKKEPFQIIRAEKTWRFVKPVDALMDGDGQKVVIQAAVDLKPYRRIGKVTDISEFGLDKPHMTVTFGLKSKRAVVVQIGDRTPTREFRYASLKSNKTSVFLLKIDDINQINRPVFELRDRSIVPILPDDAQRIVVEPREQVSFTVIRKGKEKWEMIAPVKDIADSTETEGIVSTLRWKKVVRFIEEDPKDLSKYGLDKPGYTVRIFTDKKGKKGDGIHLGKTTTEEVKGPRGKKTKQVLFYARKISGGPVILIGGNVIKDLPREPFKLRKKGIVDYDVDHITRLRLDISSESIDILRIAKKKWNMEVTGAGGKKVKMTGRHKHIDDVLWDIKWSNAVEFVDEPGKDLKKYKLGPKTSQRVSIWIKKKKDGPEVKKTILLGALVDDEKSYGRLDETKRLFAFSKKDFGKIFRTSFYLSDRRLTKFDKDEDIVKVTATFPSGEVILQRSGEEWIVKKPAGEKGNGSAVGSLITMLKELEHDGEAKAATGYDFKKFRATILIENKDGKKLGPITFAGGGTKDTLYIRIGKDGKVLRVRKALVGPNLPESPKALLLEKKKAES